MKACDCYGCWFMGQGTCGAFECDECGRQCDERLDGDIDDEGRFRKYCDACTKERAS